MLKAETQRSSGTTCPAKAGATSEGLFLLFARDSATGHNRTSVKWSLIKHHLIVGYFRLVPNIMFVQQKVVLQNYDNYATAGLP
jgi:hypothetical protein